MTEVKQDVRQFYDQVGWKLVGDDIYQNARYEDLRPVSQRYIHDCHLRVARHLRSSGRFLLDAGSGPVQYPEYLAYSSGYERRVCADISFTALIEARRRLGDHGLYVVADITNLPFENATFDGIVSLHTIHHLPEDEHLNAFSELSRLLAPGCSAVIVNGWSNSRLMKACEPFVRSANSFRHFTRRLIGIKHKISEGINYQSKRPHSQAEPKADAEPPKGTFTNKHDAEWIKSEVGSRIPVRILVWRSVTVRFMRALIHPALGGKMLLRLLYLCEERFPEFFGINGKYPLIVIQKKNKAEGS